MVTIGRGRDFLRSLCEGSGWPRDLGTRLATAIVANVEFGPIFAIGLDLFRFFVAPSQELNLEQIAGVFECMLGALEVRGLEHLVNAILRWSAALVLLWGHGFDVFDCMPLCLTAWRRSWDCRAGDHEELRRWIYANSVIISESDLSDTLHGWLETSLREAFAPSPSRSHTSSSASGTHRSEQRHQVPAYTQTELKHDSASGHCILELRCHGCGSGAWTSWHRWSTDCYQEAQERMMWRKPSTKNWAHARCPACALEGGWR